jgi:F0F1-type ATP synthase assembly protein I
MTETKAPKSTPSPAKKVVQTPDKGGDGRSSTAIFVSMALDMAWRLAIVVLVPILGGFYMDKTLDSSPALFIAGFVLAMLGMGVVLWQTLQAANRVEVPKKAKEKHS